jgi:hypothetical protein
MATMLSDLKEKVAQLSAKPEDEPEVVEEYTEDEDKTEAKKEEEKGAMDAAIKAMFVETSKRDDLASQLSDYIGVFDHKEKTLDEVAQYGVKKLKLTCDEGLEAAVLQGYLAARKANTSTNAKVALDSTCAHSSQLDKYINEGARI